MFAFVQYCVWHAKEFIFGYLFHVDVVGAQVYKTFYG